MSTEQPGVDPGARFTLAPNVSLRPERFGALAYSFDTRKLSFLKHPDLVAVLERLDGSVTIREALDEVGVDHAPSWLLPRRPGHPRDLGDDRTCR